ncbi:oligopeptide ABC transporter substrate-binding protein [Lacticaseibacillus paracasei]|jgi:peptide/nickel transport system substrate-binding protein|uniref:oligopeptide ABC transporter substrate-binding protein n=1 Tax=Lacticaseibacillus paracasei TaxID=1597 RepID=UPI0011F0AB2E|nr:oligopeptide ABC transporter substrate-binding protein [Lacticaseibacillus paracasei]KAA1051397.1 oligopeptide ABC transporter substrate-binding protein [Lacticaseibacillus paracasei]MDK6821825.1 oligopeptide ABC transporter substrate-binding protein [Lacticaseibacillus paracasei]MDK7798603.1 oligopeptide ABC transporter substrate-binding protein [Lacticaseibacillus paracasei]UYW99490.1 oligopeptide ABC transporter substrate-binding protein [Lacticaseibacillus paracasei subsp. tolerans]UYX0
MKKRSVFGMITLATALSITLVACGSKSSNSSSSTANKAVKFPVSYNNSAKAIKGGNVNVAVVNDSPFKGVFNEELYTDNYDNQYMSPAAESLFAYNSKFKFNNTGAATLKQDNSAKTITVTVKPNVKWSDGQPVVARDLVYAYEIMANKATKSQRYTESLQNIEGLTEYHDGKADSISGLTMPKGDNGDTMVIHFKQMKPSFGTSGNGYFLENAAPYHYLHDVAFDKLESSDKVRKQPLFFGPYKMSKIVAGQSIEYTPNQYYWKGKPTLDKITFENVSTASITSALKNHKYDVVYNMPADSYNDWKSIGGYDNLGRQSLAYNYIGFKLGKWDHSKSENIYNPKAKMANKSLRQAMGYAMNNDQVAAKFYNGTRSRATTLIPPVFGKDVHADIDGYNLNIKKANSLLDKAGYKKGKDGYRADPDGKKLTINFATMAGGSTAQPMAQNYIQQWKKIGLRVKLTTGRPIEFNSFYDKVQKDDKDVDVYAAAWSLSSDPSPMDLYSQKAPFNYSRFVSAKNTELLNDIDGQKALSASYRAKALKDWQKYANDEAFVIPTLYRQEIYPVNKRVKNASVDYASTANLNWAKMTVTSSSRASK